MAHFHFLIVIPLTKIIIEDFARVSEIIVGGDVHHVQKEQDDAKTCVPDRTRSHTTWRSGWSP